MGSFFWISQPIMATKKMLHKFPTSLKNIKKALAFPIEFPFYSTR